MHTIASSDKRTNIKQWLAISRTHSRSRWLSLSLIVSRYRYLYLYHTNLMIHTSCMHRSIHCSRASLAAAAASLGQVLLLGDTAVHLCLSAGVDRLDHGFATRAR